SNLYFDEKVYLFNNSVNSDLIMFFSFNVYVVNKMYLLSYDFSLLNILSLVPELFLRKSSIDSLIHFNSCINIFFPIMSKGPTTGNFDNNRFLTNAFPCVP